MLTVQPNQFSRDCFYEATVHYAAQLDFGYLYYLGVIFCAHLYILQNAPAIRVVQ